MSGKIEKLGITVVYLVSERNGPLLDIHLSQIEKYTDVPYTIYGSAERLLPQFRSKLEQNPRVKICKCETFDISSWTDKDTIALQSRNEQTFYLEQLIKKAIEDNVTHVAILHVDSFPIKRGWAQKMAARLSEKCVLAAIIRDQNKDRKPLTACILFHRDFYLKYNPRLLLTEQKRSSPEYQRYRTEVPHCTDCGVGYGFKIFTEGLIWYQLTRSNRGGEHPLFAGVYDDLVFHLSAAAYKDSTGSVGFTPRDYPKSYVRTIIKKTMETLLGERVRRKITDHIPLKVRRPDRYQEYLAWEQERQRLLEDPDSYIEYLRTGKSRA